MSDRSNISLVGNTTIGTNLGGGVCVFKCKDSGNNLQFKTLSGGTGGGGNGSYSGGSVGTTNLGGGGGGAGDGTHAGANGGSGVVIIVIG